MSRVRRRAQKDSGWLLAQRATDQCNGPVIRCAHKLVELDTAQDRWHRCGRAMVRRYVDEPASPARVAPVGRCAVRTSRTRLDHPEPPGRRAVDFRALRSDLGACPLCSSRSSPATRGTRTDSAEVAEDRCVSTRAWIHSLNRPRVVPRRVGGHLRPGSDADRYIYIMSIPERAARGSMKEAVGVHIKLTPEIYEQLAQAAADRGVSKRALLTAALVRELTDPSLDKPQDTLYDVAS